MGAPHSRDARDRTLGQALRAFGVTGDVVPLPGGSRQTFRVGEVVLKHIHETSLENNHSRELVQWIADLFSRLDQSGFRIARPQRSAQGAWLTEDGWTAWSLLKGHHARLQDIPACIAAIIAFHRALAGVPKHALLDASTTPWAVAHRACLGSKPAAVHPTVAGLVDRLYALRRPVGGQADQLLHGDLNPENILIAAHEPPAFLDMSPFWGPVALALAIFANFIGPRRGDVSVLRQFDAIEHFDQMLVRAGIRMLIVMSEVGDLRDWGTCPERDAAYIIIRHVERSLKP